MMVFGLRVSEIPPFMGKKWSILMALSTMCTSRALGYVGMVGCDEQLGSIP
jgi:hypothetical protein